MKQLIKSIIDLTENGDIIGVLYGPPTSSDNESIKDIIIALIRKLAIIIPLIVIGLVIIIVIVSKRLKNKAKQDINEVEDLYGPPREPED